MKCSDRKNYSIRKKDASSYSSSCPAIGLGMESEHEDSERKCAYWGLCYIARIKQNDKVNTERLSVIQRTATADWTNHFMPTFLPREVIFLE